MKTKNRKRSATFLQLVAKEVSAARSQHGPMKSLHEGYAVILEELDEVWDEVKKKTRERDMEHLLEELVQVAAMCVKTAEDVVMPKIK